MKTILHGLQPVSYLLLVIALSVMTTLCFEYLPRFQIHSGDLGIGNLQSTRETQRAIVENNSLGDTITLSNKVAGQRVKLFQWFKIPTGGLVELSAKDVATRDVEAAEEAWQQARIEVIAFDKAGNPKWDFDNTLVHLLGTHKTHDISKIIAIPAHYQRARIEISLPGNIGELRLSSISILEATAHPYQRLLDNLLLLLWLVLFAFILKALVRSKPLFTLGLCIIGGLLTILPGSEKAFLIALMPGMPLLDLSHLLLFFLAGIYGRYSFPTTRWPTLVLALLAISMATETLQYFAPNRNPGFADLISNITGGLLGMLIYELWGRFVKTQIR